jgi:tight adherence protein C
VLSPLGVPTALAAPALVAVKLVFLIGGPLAGLGYHLIAAPEGNPLVPLLCGLVGGILIPSLILSRIRKRYMEALNRSLPDTLDLLVVCAEAGLGLESAIDRVAADMREAAPGMALEFAQLGQEMRLLPDRSVAMERFAERAELEGLRRLASTLAQAMRYGTPLSQALRALAADQRNERMLRLEAKAARLPALLVLPLVAFILPPLFIILVGPSFIRLVDTMQGF